MTVDRESDAPRRGIGILVVAFEAARTIEHVLDRIPTEVLGVAPRVLIADDASTDHTVAIALRWAEGRPPGTTEVVRRTANLGYGGNQKAGYRWAIDNDLDVVALLHGDAQYQPERIPQLIESIVAGRSDAVLGSRMVDRGGAKRGGMPLTRRLGNRTLSTLQNVMTGQRFSEWHSGLRAYRVSTLAAIDLDALPDGFDFDTALMLELLGRGDRISEISIPTRYADEKSRVQLFRFGFQVLGRTARYRWGRLTR